MRSNERLQASRLISLLACPVSALVFCYYLWFNADSRISVMALAVVSCSDGATYRPSLTSSSRLTSHCSYHHSRFEVKGRAQKHRHRYHLLQRVSSPFRVNRCLNVWLIYAGRAVGELGDGAIWTGIVGKYAVVQLCLYFNICLLCHPRIFFSELS